MATTLTKDEYRKEWIKHNKDKLAMYARAQYQKKVTENPEYRQVLVQRTLDRRKRLRENQEPKPRGRPKKEPSLEEEKPKKPNGRPRKYPLIEVI